MRYVRHATTVERLEATRKVPLSVNIVTTTDMKFGARTVASCKLLGGDNVTSTILSKPWDFTRTNGAIGVSCESLTSRTVLEGRSNTSGCSDGVRAEVRHNRAMLQGHCGSCRFFLSSGLGPGAGIRGMPGVRDVRDVRSIAIRDCDASALKDASRQAKSLSWLVNDDRHVLVCMLFSANERRVDSHPPRCTVNCVPAKHGRDDTLAAR
ncbi:hypothetical protein BTE28158_05092 [Burkholderia territorii]|nr:hypothetical protein BTE28158_05092 [Burkholderia territorii]